MKFAYMDESGHGGEPILVIAGVVADATRMHITKEDWDKLLGRLSGRVGRPLLELKTREFYKGNGVWKELNGLERSSFIDEVLKWLEERKHGIVFTGIEIGKLKAATAPPAGASGLSAWVLAALHVTLGLQKEYQTLPGVKGHTVVVFDDSDTEKSAFVPLVIEPPTWTDSFYSKGAKQASLNRVVDVPYFANSQHVGLLQVADLFAFLLRNHAEVGGGLRATKYIGEKEKLAAWAKDIASLALPRATRWPKQKPCECAKFYTAIAPAALMDLK